MERRSPVVVPHDHRWADMFNAEAAALRHALGSAVRDIHHIGSTAIVGMPAKPIIDILVEAESLPSIDARNGAMSAAGYEAKGEHGVAGRRYFRRSNARGARTHHVHVFEAGSTGAVRLIAFRDFMRTHPDEAARYAELKLALAEAHTTDIRAYVDGKDRFVRQAESCAVDWMTACS